LNGLDPTGRDGGYAPSVPNISIPTVGVPRPDSTGSAFPPQEIGHRFRQIAEADVAADVDAAHNGSTGATGQGGTGAGASGAGAAARAGLLATGLSAVGGVIGSDLFGGTFMAPGAGLFGGVGSTELGALEIAELAAAGVAVGPGVVVGGVVLGVAVAVVFVGVTYGASP